MQFETYFYWSGLLLNVAVVCFILLAVWVWFIWPIVEACSITRMYIKAGCRRKRVFKVFLYYVVSLSFGRQFTSIRGDGKNCRWEWDGVGKWKIFKDDEK